MSESESATVIGQSEASSSSSVQGMDLEENVNVAGAWPNVVDLSVFGLFDDLCRISHLARFYVIYFYLRGWRNVSFFVTL